MARLHAAALLFALAAPALAQNCSAPVPGNITASVHFKAVSDYLDSVADDLWPLNKEIHDNPELGYEEVEAHNLLTSFMESQDGWNVTRSLGGIDTAFMAVFEGSGEGPVVSFNAEYDALPGLGHACGHNLIATVSVGGALATAEIMRAESLTGRVILFGTPAEESLGGKVKMLEAGLFDDAQIDISLISHPTAGNDSPYMITTATDRFDVEYHGREAHAAASPWEGVNAQDALLVANTALGFMRQQMRPSDKVHGFIASGGSRINVIPALATASYQIRSNDAEQLANFTERVVACFEAGALASGAEMNLTMRPYGYANMVSNDALAEAYTTWFEGLGGGIEDPVIDKKRDPSGSTDQGNISHDFPSISPYFGITNEDGSQPAGGPHTTAFEVASGSRAAFDKAIMVAKSLAGVAVDVLTVEGLLEKIKEEFEQTKKSSKRKARRQS
ncbi:Peptidase M20 domain-containing protein 2 like [Verticillium longisporum]|uniref:Peptidase M20 domain-containing protein 2 n=1 Tax=Verticillium longisporum TaxID=100787 RepID=A0A8I3AFF3_VERLO|nr:Peptidase M20 domain-containing protein 2 like [Verticillium longisporum]KAG7110746.1 Peptidase M20 domain-containing protein 2 like [Verticillium longisporum]